MTRIKNRRGIIIACFILSGMAVIGSVIFSDVVPYSGVIGWSLGLVFFISAVYFLVTRQSAN